MSNIFTQSITPPFTKQSVSEYFIDPMFMGEDIRGAVTIRTDIKGTEKLNRVSRPSMITKPKTTAGFNPAGTFSLSTTDLTVKPMAIEFEQNGREFWGSIAEQLLATGYKEDDVNKMKNPDVWNKVMLPIIAQAGQKDLVRQMWFSDTSAESLSSLSPSGTADDNFNGYTGFMSHLLSDYYNDDISSTQHVKIDSSVTAVKAEKILTYTASGDTTITVTINGDDYAEAYDTNATTTVVNWLATHKATIEARAGINGVVVTNPTGSQIKIVSKYGGQIFTFTAVADGSGSFASSGVVAAVKSSTLTTDEADGTLESMIDKMPSELLELDPVFMISRSMFRNLVHTWKNMGTERANEIAFKGISVPSYEGVPILVRPDWDLWISSSFNGILPHRALLTTQKNLVFGTDATSDSDMMETWYNQDLQMRRYRVQYKANTAYLHKELLVLAGFGDA
jgi:hypothetical protein